jgi:hypothetical protein
MCLLSGSGSEVMPAIDPEGDLGDAAGLRCSIRQTKFGGAMPVALLVGPSESAALGRTVARALSGILVHPL